MANPLDWTAEKFEGTENPLGWAIGKSLRGINWASGGLLRGSGSLLRGAGRGVGSLRDRMSRQDMGQDDFVSPERIPSDDGGLGNSGEILIRLTSIENILRGMSQLSAESNNLDIEAIENDKQAEEALHRLAEQEPDGPDISMSPIRVEEEKKSGGLFSSLFSGLGKLLTFLGPTGSVIVGLGLLAGGLALVNKFFGWGDGEEGGEGRERLDPTTGQIVRMAAGVPGVGIAAGTGIAKSTAWGMTRTAAGMEARSATTPQRISRAIDAAESNLAAANAARSGLGNAPRPPIPSPTEIETSPSFKKRVADYDRRTAAWKAEKARLEDGVAAARKKSDDVAKAVGRRTGRLTTNASRLQRIGSKVKVMGPLGAGIGVGMDAWTYQDMEEGWQKDLKALAILLGTYGAVASMTGVGIPAGGLALLGAMGLSLAADYGDRIPDLWDWTKEQASGAVDFALDRSTERPHQVRPFRAPQSKRGYIQSELEHAGYSHNQAQAVMQNMSDESGFDEDAVGDGGTAFGIAQWRGDRARDMRAHVAGAGGSEFEGQVGFLIKELADYNLSPEQMPEEYAEAYNTVMREYERPAEWAADRREIPSGTPAPGGETPAQVRDARDLSGVGAFSYGRRTPTPVEQTARGRTAPAAADTEGDGALTPTAVVAPQTTNNFFDNRSTNILPPPLDARNREAGVVALQNLQGLTAALG